MPPNNSGIEPAGSATPDAGAECIEARGTTSIETKWAAIALLYGPPERWWRDGFQQPVGHWLIPLRFRIILEKFFDPREVQCVGLRHMAYDYAQWYLANEKDHQGPST